MNKRIYAIAIAICMVMPLLAAATQRVQAQSTATISLIDQSVIEQAHTTFYVNIGDTINLTLYVQDASSLWSWKVNVTWDNSILQLAPTNNVTEGPFLSSNGASTTLFLETPPTPGNIQELSSTLLENTSVTGSGALAYIVFSVQKFTGTGNTTINITDTRLLDTSGNDMSNTSVSKTIVVHGPGDVNGDDRVDMKDIAIVAAAFGTVAGEKGYSDAADVNHDGKVDMKDIAIVAALFGTVYS